MRIRFLFARLSAAEIEDVVVVLRIIMGGAVISALFQEKFFGILVAIVAFFAVRYMRKLLLEKNND